MHAPDGSTHLVRANAGEAGSLSALVGSGTHRRCRLPECAGEQSTALSAQPNAGQLWLP